MNLPTIDDIREARQTIAPHIRQTPVLTSRQFDERCGAEVYFKCENFQRVGAFKFRGGCNTVLSLPEEKTRYGVATHSSGNHAQAVALSAKIRDIPAYIVMPEDAPSVKVNAVRGYGATITFCASTQEAREDTLNDVLEKRGATFIHPFNNPKIIAGQGTAALELVEEVPDLDAVLAPVGGGGLASGTAIAAKSVKPGISVIGTEPERANDAYLSLREGKIIPPENPDTVADGLRTSLGELTFACMREYLDEIVTVTEQEIIEAMQFIWERMKIVIEPSSAVPVAALFAGKIETAGRRLGIIISGGNVDLDHLPWNQG